MHLYKSDDHMQNWFDCIKSRRRPVADVAIGHSSTTLCHLANISMRVGRRLKFDRASERFIGDAEANTYLTKEYRKGYELPML